MDGSDLTVSDRHVCHDYDAASPPRSVKFVTLKDMQEYLTGITMELPESPDWYGCEGIPDVVAAVLAHQNDYGTLHAAEEDFIAGYLGANNRLKLQQHKMTINVARLVQQSIYEISLARKAVSCWAEHFHDTDYQAMIAPTSGECFNLDTVVELLENYINERTTILSICRDIWPDKVDGAERFAWASDGILQYYGIHVALMDNGQGLRVLKKLDHQPERCSGEGDDTPRAISPRMKEF